MPNYTFMPEGDLAHHSTWNLLVSQIIENLNILEFRLDMESTVLWSMESGFPRCWCWKTMNGWTLKDRIDEVRAAIGYEAFQWPSGFNLLDQSRFMSAADLARIARAVGYQIAPSTTYKKDVSYHDTDYSKTFVYKYNLSFKLVNNYSMSLGYCDSPSLYSQERLHPAWNRYTWSYTELPGFGYYGILVNVDCIADFQPTGAWVGEPKFWEGDLYRDINGTQRGLIYAYTINDSNFSLYQPEIWISGKINEGATATEHQKSSDITYQREDSQNRFHWRGVRVTDITDSNLSFPQVKITQRSESPAGQSGNGDDDDSAQTVLDTVNITSGKFDTIFDYPANEFFIGIEFDDGVIFDMVDQLNLNHPSHFYNGAYWAENGDSYKDYDEHDEITREINVSLGESFTWMACKQ